MPTEPSPYGPITGTGDLYQEMLDLDKRDDEEEEDMDSIRNAISEGLTPGISVSVRNEDYLSLSLQTAEPSDPPADPQPEPPTPKPQPESEKAA